VAPCRKFGIEDFSNVAGVAVRSDKRKWFLGLALTALLAGCGQPPEPVFSVNEKRTTLIGPAQEAVANFLSENFGSPNKLVGWKELPIDYGTAQPGHPNSLRHQDGWRLAEGRNLYMLHCLHCHGVAGDGAGPTANFMIPKPRDYRPGLFKFKSTQYAIKPSHADLTRVLMEGIPGTYMPSFALLGDEQVGLLVDYVRWLSMRGEAELKLVQELAGSGATLKGMKDLVASESAKEGAKSAKEIEAEAWKEIETEFRENTIKDVVTSLVEDWKAAELHESVVLAKAPRVHPDAESIERGRRLYLGQGGAGGKPGAVKCSDCHGLSGRGDGPNTELFWKITGSQPEQTYDHPGLHDDWGHVIQPRNLTRGVYRFGRKPIDLYRRINQGIRGTPMPKADLSDQELWDLVNYVMSLPFDEKHSAAPDDVEKVAVEKGHGQRLAGSPAGD